MDFTHWLVLGFIWLAEAIVVVGFYRMMRALERDEAIDAATFLALRELRERFEQSRKSRSSRGHGAAANSQ